MAKTDEYIKIEKNFRNIQNSIIKNFSLFDRSSRKSRVNWNYKSGGGGISYEFNDGKLIERAMVNFSSINGDILPKSALQKRLKGKVSKFYATGVSVVVHPNNPFMPCSHMNVRYFETDEKSNKSWWFGGGYDLTPYFPNKADIKEWHDSAKKVCDKYDKKFYERFSKDCDDYFYNVHRKEKRGIGGIFFDQLNLKDKDIYRDFVDDVAKTYLNTYIKIIAKYKKKKYLKIHKEFQLVRRGRYVEFNLLYDRGTLFGLQSGGRPESILMSMPPLVMWGDNNKKLIKFERELKKFL